MNNPQLSIIIPTLNEEKYLPLLLQDLSIQTDKNFEIILVDGNSKDKTIQIAKKYSLSLPSLQIHSLKQAHVCLQRNIGAKYANSKILLFSDADNRLPPNFLNDIVQYLSSHQVNILTTWYKPISNLILHKGIALYNNLTQEVESILKFNYIQESLVIVDKNTFWEIGGFNSSCNYGEGNEFIRKAYQLNKTINTIRQPYYYYSFRRYINGGFCKLIVRTSYLYFAKIFGDKYRNKISPILYPMTGGTQYKKPD